MWTFYICKIFYNKVLINISTKIHFLALIFQGDFWHHDLSYPILCPSMMRLLIKISGLYNTTFHLTIRDKGKKVEDHEDQLWEAHSCVLINDQNLIR